MTVFVSDLDGTFLRNDLTFDRDKFASLLAQTQAANSLFVIATGRELKWIEEKFADFLDQVGIVASNGGVVKLPEQTAPLVETVDPAALAPLQDLLDQFDEIPVGGVRAYSKDRIYLLDGYGEIDATTREHMTKVYQGVTTIEKLTDIEEPVTTLTGNWSEAGSHAFIELLSQSDIPVRGTTSGYGTVDILPAGVNKAVALEKLLKLAGRASEEPVRTFGDGMNDWEMLHWADTGYVMPNGAPALLEDDALTPIPWDNQAQGVLRQWQHDLEQAV